MTGIIPKYNQLFRPRTFSVWTFRNWELDQMYSMVQLLLKIFMDGYKSNQNIACYIHVYL